MKKIQILKKKLDVVRFKKSFVIVKKSDINNMINFCIEDIFLFKTLPRSIATDSMLLKNI